MIEAGVAVLVVAVLIIAIWVIIEMKRMRHKVFALFLIALVLFSYLSFTFVLRDKDVDLKTLDGIKTAGSLYFAWLGSVFSNLKSVTANAINLDWKGNETG